MKKIIILAVLIIHTIMLQAQFKSTYTAKFDTLFSNVSLTNATTGILYERVIPFAQLYNFNSNLSNSIDTSSMKHFIQAYFELYNATFAAQTLPFDVEYLRQTSHKDRSPENISAVDIGILLYRFNMIDSVVASQKLYLGIDSLLQENPAIVTSLFVEKIAFVAAPLKSATSVGITHFRFSNLFRFENMGNHIAQLNVDFGDGMGIRQVNDSLVTITYSTKGLKTLRFEVLLDNGATLIAYATINCLQTDHSRGSNWQYIEKLIGNNAIQAKITPPNPYTGGTFGKAKGDVWIYYASADKVLRKPILIVDGFDPTNTRVIDDPDESKGETSIWDMLGCDNYEQNDCAGENVAKLLLDKGYDLVFVDFHDGGIYIEQNAMVCIEVINEINRRLQASGSLEEIIAMGPSMGGTITRYALAYMEKNPNANTNYGKHNCRLWVSFAAPHQGANIAYGAQALMRFFGYTAGVSDAKYVYDNLINCSAARQMLKKHYSSSANSVYNTFYSSMNTLGYPNNLRKIAISNGSLNNFPNGTGCQLAIDIYAKANINVGKIKLWPNSGTCEVFKGKYVEIAPWWMWLLGIPYIEVTSEKVTVSADNGQCSIDAAPGCKFYTFKMIKEAFIENKQIKKIELSNESHCFMPTMSVLDVSGITYYCTDLSNRDLVAEGKTPFNAYWGPINKNMGHATLDQSLVNWVLNEIETYIVPNNKTISLCDISEYSVHFPAGKNSPVTWTCSSNLEIISGQGTQTIHVRPLNTGDGWVEATLTGNNILTHNKTLNRYSVTVIYNQSVTYAPAQITNTQTWNTPYLIAGKTYINNGATLTIKSNTDCASSAELIIQPGGKLIIDGGTLNSACTGEMWQGITVNNQGSVEVKNNSQIRNAICGVTVKGGGTVSATNAHFANNKLGVKFEPLSGQTGISSSFSGTNFVLDNGYLGNPADFEAHIKMESSGSANITSCTFSSTVPLATNKGIVISNCSTNWTGTNQIKSVSLDIKSGATLTNTGTINSNENVKITVYPTSKIILNGGTFKNASPNIMWQGITINNQGAIEMKNGGKIENATCGITVQGGGAVSATNAHFVNNKLGVKFEQLSGQTATPSSFSGTDFVLDNNFFGNLADFEAHLKMESSGSNNITSCTFSSTTSLNSNKGIIVSNTTTNWAGTNQLLSIPVLLQSSSILNNIGTINIQSGSVFTNSGSTLTNTGNINIQSESVFSNSSSTLTNTGTINIQSGSIFTSKGIINSNNNAQITVYPTSKLIVDGGTLTNASPNVMWQGITVNNQGSIEVKNNGTISNAICGITVNGGGTVSTNNAHFVNNKLGVKLEPSGQSGTLSSFNGTDFVLNNNFFGNLANFEAHLKMEGSDNVNVTSCTFSSTVPLNLNQGVVVSNSSTNWAGNNQLLSVPLDIKSGTVTHTGTIRCNENAKITVYPNAYLTVDGGTITSASTDKMWQGITVLNDSYQHPHQILYEIKIINGAKIENALCALHVKNGDRVLTYNASFNNNRMGIKFESYLGYTNNSGDLSYTQFVQDEHYIGNPAEAGEHLIMDSCGQVSIQNCSFSRPNSINNPKGIVVSKANLAWSNNNYLESVPLDVLAGSTVTISGNMYGSDKITVYPAGKMVINGELSNYNNMQQWKGIDVIGNLSQPVQCSDSLQILLKNQNLPPDEPQLYIPPGTVQITNGGTIKNAKTGITAIAGGVVNASNAHFINNLVGVHFKPTTIQNGTSGTFSQTEFVITGNHVNPTGSGVFLKMDSCGQVLVTNCNFSSSVPLDPNQGVVVTNASTHWSGVNQLLSVPVSLFANATLTNTGTIMSDENTDIAVHPDGKLMIDGGIFTNATSGVMWKGITVQGKVSRPAKTGFVVLQNGGAIKNALLGIHALGGSSVTATNASFSNNKVGVQAEQSSVATFTNTQFNITFRYPNSFPSFDVHLKLLNRNPVTISNCTFVNETNQVNQNSMKENNIGIKALNTNITCLNSSFSGFNNAISASNSGTIPSVSVTNSTFSNNLYGIKLNGSNYPIVRDNQLDVTLENAVGIYNSNSTGYTITENTIAGTPFYKNIGIQIENSGIEENLVYKNYLQERLFIGIQAIDVNSWQDTINDPMKFTGLQILCNEFKNIQEADIVVGPYPKLQNYPNADHSVRTYQGDPYTPAGNDFINGAPISIANYSNYDIYYFLSDLTANEALNGVTGNVFKESLFIPSDCSSRYSKIGGDLDEALSQYDEWNDDNYFNSIIVAAMGDNSPSNFEGVDDAVGRGSLYETLRFLFNYRNHYADNLCIVETYLAESNFGEALAMLDKIYEKFKLTSEQVNELTGLQVYVNWLQQLEKEGRNIYELSEKELDYLINYVKTNTGRGTVFANIILCELYGICLEGEGEKGRTDEGTNARRDEGTKAESESHVSCLTSNQSLLEKITLVPNPTTGELHVTRDALHVTNVEIFDIYGRKAISDMRLSDMRYPTSNIGTSEIGTSEIKINISHLPPGIYFVRITTEAGEVVRKVVKM